MTILLENPQLESEHLMTEISLALSPAGQRKKQRKMDKGRGLLRGALAEEAWQTLAQSVGCFQGLASMPLDNQPYSALELGLMSTFYFNKGCYTGQESIGKIVSSNAVRRHLCHLNISLSDTINRESESENGNGGDFAGSSSKNNLFVAVGDRFVEANGDDEVVAEVVSVPNQNLSPAFLSFASSWRLLGEAVEHVSSPNHLLCLALVKKRLAYQGNRLMLTKKSHESHENNSVFDATVKLADFPRFNSTISSPDPPIVKKVITKGKSIVSLSTGPSLDKESESESVRKKEKLEKLEEKVRALTQRKNEKKK